MEIGECFQQRIRDLLKHRDVNVGGECAYWNIVYIDHVSRAHIFLKYFIEILVFLTCVFFKGSLKYSIFYAFKPNFPVFK